MLFFFFFMKKRGKETVADRQILLADADFQSLIHDSLTPLVLIHYISHLYQ